MTTWNKTLNRMEKETGIPATKYNVGFVALNFWNKWDSTRKENLDLYFKDFKKITPKTQPELQQVSEYTYKLI